ncbi:hypothetical protein COW46_02075 [Candidatus Gracilibacteria bacterium CG17_big_fil_post_rev_8_21_14_2_50_48_13]|nr:MAG: hypothetical protein COW46_02075 [Candidatus Gracilibacteria bacterium CG17_big_fil_post_rev_8_21_14_2_50_48_13]
MFKKDFWVTFAFAFLLAWLLQVTFFAQPPAAAPISGTGNLLTVTSHKSTYTVGDEVIITIKANTGSLMKPLVTTCPESPFEVRKDGEIITAKTTYACAPSSMIPTPDTPLVFSYRNWNAQLFSTPGKYTITIPYEGGTYVTDFNIEAEGWFAAAWNTVFTRPIYNALVGLTLLLGNNLGWGIIALTLIIRLLLLIPSQQAMESQRRMQKIQPRLQEFQKLYKNDQQRLSTETMKLMKENKVNPLGSCLPLLLQIPVLLAVFLSIQNGLNVSFTHHLYEPLRATNIEAIQYVFLGFLDLSKPEVWVLPWLLGAIQFLQLKMSFAKLPKQAKAQAGVPDMSSMNKVFTYMIPGIIAISALTLPAGVGLYWLISTIFGIGQQYFVNKEKLV